MEKIYKLLFTLFYFLFHLEGVYAENTIVKPNDVMSLFSRCVENCRINQRYNDTLRIIVDNNYKDIDTTLLSARDKKRIEFLILGVWEDWELNILVNRSEWCKKDIKEKQDKDYRLKMLKDTVLIAKRKKEIADSLTIEYKKEIRIDHATCKTYIIDLILEAQWRQYIPMLEDLYKKTKSKKCFCDYDLKYKLALFHVEPYLTDCIKEYGYDKEKQNVNHFRALMSIRTPAAIYEMCKALHSTKIMEDGLVDYPTYIKYFYLYILADLVGFPPDPSGNEYVDYIMENTKEDALPKEQMEIILKWIEENKETLHFKE